MHSAKTHENYCLSKMILRLILLQGNKISVLIFMTILNKNKLKFIKLSCLSELFLIVIQFYY